METLRNNDRGDIFSMPYLQADDLYDDAGESSTTEPIKTDPREARRREKVRRARRTRLIVLAVVVVVLVVLGVIYGVRFSGYRLAVFRYVKGIDYESGSMYVSIVPDSYIDYIDGVYGYSRREIKEKVGSYFTTDNANYSGDTRLSYRITDKEWLEDSDVAAIEAQLKSSYGITVDASKAVTVTLKISGSGTQTATFFKVGMRWCSLEALDTIDWVCKYSGYNLW